MASFPSLCPRFSSRDRHLILDLSFLCTELNDLRVKNKCPISVQMPMTVLAVCYVLTHILRLAPGTLYLGSVLISPRQPHKA